MHESCRRCCVDDGECRSLPDFSIAVRRESSVSVVFVVLAVLVVWAGPSAAALTRGLFVAQAVEPSSGVVERGPPGTGVGRDRETGESGTVDTGAVGWECSSDDDTEDDDEERPGTKFKLPRSCCTGESGGWLLSDEDGGGRWCESWEWPSCPSDDSAGPPSSSASPASLAAVSPSS